MKNINEILVLFLNNNDNYYLEKDISFPIDIPKGKDETFYKFFILFIKSFGNVLYEYEINNKIILEDYYKIINEINSIFKKYYENDIINEFIYQWLNPSFIIGPDIISKKFYLIYEDILDTNSIVKCYKYLELANKFQKI
jgi:hypothetical protein